MAVANTPPTSMRAGWRRARRHNRRQTSCDAVSSDIAFPEEFASWGFGPYEPFGANDGKVVDSRLGRQLRFLGRFGHPCGQVFDARKFLEEHPQYAWQAQWLRDKPEQPWTEFTSGDRQA
jgi:hypothetical protein